MWKEKAKKERDREKNNKKESNFLQENTPLSTPMFSRVHIGRSVATRNRRRPRAIALNARLRTYQTAMEKSMLNIKKSDRIRNKWSAVPLHRCTGVTNT